MLGNDGAWLAWPIVMSSTVATGQLWSLYLGEWYYATDKAMNRNILSLIFLLVAVVLIAVGGVI